MQLSGKTGNFYLNGKVNAAQNNAAKSLEYHVKSVRIEFDGWGNPFACRIF